ncbi:piggyBac transposable element-derived protein 2-like [Apostichopus japonicus]|uniref:piggyBac transposable element-derived protein 2-like n=1 Tax=Stichopus japonicus TaxID=307972 RepID=UPI003AB50E18
MAKSWSADQVLAMITGEGPFPSITDEQAFNSDDGGDSDAEDEMDVSTVTTRSGRSSMNNSQDGSADEEDGEDNDDDEDYHPNDDIQVERTVPYSDSDESDEELVQRKPKVRKEETNESLNWTKAESKPKTYDEFTFAEPKGMTKPVESSSSPIAFVSLLITTSLLEHIVSQSNLYATQSGVDLNTSLEEMKAFLGLLIITGFHSLPSMFLYWSSDLNCHVEVVSKVMAVKRFRKLMRYIHLNNDNAKMPARDSEQFDKLYKVRPIIVHFNKVFLELFKPSRFLSIDESMIAFKGRSSLKQYMPLKPIEVSKFG